MGHTVSDGTLVASSAECDPAVAIRGPATTVSGHQKYPDTG